MTYAFSSHWHDTLIDFLNRSDEDRAYGGFFDKFSHEWRRSIEPRDRDILHWMDIGAGPGSKTKALFDRIREAGMPVHLTTLDPEPGWHEHLSGTRFDNGAGYEYIRGRFEHILADDCGEWRGTHLFTAFHVLYDEHLVDEFARGIEALPSAMFVLSAECLTSELSQLRRDVVSMVGMPCTRSYLPDLADRVKEMGRRVKEVPIGDQTLRLTEACIGTAEEPGWFMPFLLGMRPVGYSTIAATRREDCRQLVLDSFPASASGIRTIAIPDQALIVHPDA